MADPSKTRSAVLLDPHPLWLDAVEGVLSNLDVAVVGRATAPELALTLVEKTRPDLFIAEIDTRGDELDGVACVRLARERRPDLKLVVLSAQDNPRQIEAAFSAGALAYVVKTAHRNDLSAAIRQAFEPSMYFSGSVKQGLITASMPAKDPADGNGSDPKGFGALTRRELEILQLVAEGHSNAQLAKMLWVAEQTVKFHLSNVYRKLDVTNRTEASRWAQLHNILPAAPRQATTGI
ncbi:MAG TPA: response regulator transcription factor [Gaiellaceae bacterium]|nr:response regulator transcription factor [Gaiellaceae bacterium]